MACVEPVVLTQLGVPLGGSACGDFSIAIGWRIASCGKVDFRQRRPRVPKLVRELAAPVRNPTGGTFPDELERAFEAAAPMFRRHGLRAPKMRKLWTASFDEVLVPAMRKRDRSALVGVWYGVLDRLAPEISGQPGLATWHWVVITDLRRVARRKLSYPVRPGQDPDERVRAVTLLDPLADGRTPPGRTKPVWRGPATVELSLIRLAAGKVGKKKDGSGTPIGEGRVVGGIFGVAKPLVPQTTTEPAPTPDPDPTPEPTDPREELVRQLAETRALLDLAMARLEALGDLAGEPLDQELVSGTGAPEDIGDEGLVDGEEEEEEED